MNFTIAGFFCLLSTVFCQFSPLYHQCSSDRECPDNSACRPYACEGYVCLCDVGYVVSENSLSCLIAGNVSDTCDPSTVKCLGRLYAYCSEGLCMCRSYARVTEMNTCVSKTSAKVIGASCTTQDTCVTNAACVGGSCQCVGGYRERTAEEYWADPESREECFALAYSLESCQGVPLPTTTSSPTTTSTTTLPPTTTTKTTTTASTTTTSTTTTTTTTTTTPTITTTETTSTSTTTIPTTTQTSTTLTTVLTTSKTGTLIFDNCTTTEQCPDISSCRPNGCLGLNCLCDWGYAPSSDRTTCLSAGNVGTACGFGVKCVSPFAYCANGLCDCLPGARRTPLFTCTLQGSKVLDETCTAGAECGILAECHLGFCSCQNGSRRKTTGEFWVDPDSSVQCVPEDFSLYICRNENVSLPFTTEIIPETTTSTSPTTATSLQTTTTSVETTTDKNASPTTTTQITTTVTTTITTTFIPRSTTTFIPTTTTTFIPTTTTTFIPTTTTTFIPTTTTTFIPTTTTTFMTTTTPFIPTTTTTQITSTPQQTKTITTKTTTTPEETTPTTSTATSDTTTATTVATTTATSSTTTSKSKTTPEASTPMTSTTSKETTVVQSSMTVSPMTTTSSQVVNESPSSSKTSSASSQTTTSPGHVESTSKASSDGTRLEEPIRPISKSDGTKVAVIVSACIAGFVFLIIIAVIVALCRRRFRYKRRLEVTGDQTVLKTYDNVELPSAAAAYMVERQ